MKSLLLALICVPLLCAQNSSLSLSPGSGSGKTISVVMSLTTPTGVTAPAGLQWSLSFQTADNAGFVIAEGQSLIDAGKTIQCSNSAALGVTTYKCLASGINTNSIAPGPVGLITFTVSAAPVDTTIQLMFSNTLAADPQGTFLALTAQDGFITIQCLPYKLTRTPVGPVLVYRNGLLQTSPGDYTSANAPGTSMPIITPLNWVGTDTAAAVYTRAVPLSFTFSGQTVSYWGYTLNRENWSCVTGKPMVQAPTTKKGK